MERRKFDCTARNDGDYGIPFSGLCNAIAEPCDNVTQSRTCFETNVGPQDDQCTQEGQENVEAGRSTSRSMVPTHDPEGELYNWKHIGLDLYGRDPRVSKHYCFC